MFIHSTGRRLAAEGRFYANKLKDVRTLRGIGTTEHLARDEWRVEINRLIDSLL